MFQNSLLVLKVHNTTFVNYRLLLEHSHNIIERHLILKNEFINDK